MGDKNQSIGFTTSNMEVDGEPIGKVKSINQKITVGGTHTNEEKALFHGLTSARRVAEDEEHEIAAEMAVLIGEYYLESKDKDD